MRPDSKVHEHEGRSKSSRSPLEDRPAVPDERTDRLQALSSRKEYVEPRIPVVFFVGRVISGDDVQNVVLDAVSHLAATVDAHEMGFQEPTSTGEIIPDRHLFGLEHRLELGGSRRRDSEHNLGRLRLGPIPRTHRVRSTHSTATTAARVPPPICLSFHLAPGQYTLRSPRHAGPSDRHYLIGAHPLIRRGSWGFPAPRDFVKDFRQGRPDIDSFLSAPRFETRQDARLDPEAVHAHRAEDRREEAHGPNRQEENPCLVGISRRVEYGHEACEEGRGSDGPEDALEQICRAHDFASRWVHDTNLEGVEQPRSRNKRREQTGEQQEDGKCDQTEPEVLDFRWTEEV